MSDVLNGERFCTPDRSRETLAAACESLSDEVAVTDLANVWEKGFKCSADARKIGGDRLRLDVGALPCITKGDSIFSWCSRYSGSG